MKKISRPLAIGLFCFQLGCRPRACRELSQKEGTLSYAAATAAGERPAAWQKRLRRELTGILRLQGALKAGQTQYTVVSAGWMFAPEIANVWVTNYHISSRLDGARMPLAVLREKRSRTDKRVLIGGPPPVAVILHGHHSGGDTALQLRPGTNDTAVALLHSGYVVAIPRIRSLSGFEIDGHSHRSYYRSKPEGEYLREVLIDSLTAIRFIQALYPDNAGITLIGHSLGGYLALHLAAVDTSIDAAVISGLFLPYACIATGRHEDCQNFPGIAGKAEMHDIAGLIAPRRLLVHFGAKDPHYTPVADELFRRTEKIFAALGGAGQARFARSPNIAHELDPAAVLPFIKRKKKAPDANRGPSPSLAAGQG